MVPGAYSPSIKGFLRHLGLHAESARWSIAGRRWRNEAHLAAYLRDHEIAWCLDSRIRTGHEAMMRNSLGVAVTRTYHARRWAVAGWSIALILAAWRGLR